MTAWTDVCENLCFRLFTKRLQVQIPLGLEGKQERTSGKEIKPP